MNKRLISVIILLLTCIAISVGGYFIVSYISYDLTEKLETFLVMTEEGDIPKAAEVIDNCVEKLDLYEKIYAIFLDHNLFESIMISIPSVKHLFETENYDEAMDKCFESIETLNIIVHEQKLTIENIF